MALQTHPLAFITFSLLVGHSIVVSAASDGQKLLRLGGPRPISEPNDHKVVEIAEFAVSKHNKLAKTNLKLQSVVNGTLLQVLAGRYYRLVISAMDGNAHPPHDYLCLIYEKPWQHLKILISFKIITTSV